MSGFDRLRPRTPEPVDLPDANAVDAEGKRALFSGGEPIVPAMGAVVVECSSCGVETAMTPRQLVRASIPSLHLPFVKKDHPSYLRCPACGKRSWVRIRFRG